VILVIIDTSVENRLCTDVLCTAIWDSFRGVDEDKSLHVFDAVPTGKLRHDLVSLRLRKL
jgi:hypothetical protein